jgi:hypothetical protein
MKKTKLFLIIGALSIVAIGATAFAYQSQLKRILI